MKRIATAVAALVGHSLIALSQSGIPSVVQGLHGDAISLSGDIGTYGELYSMSGRESRRPSSTARLYFRPRVSFYDAMTLSFNFLLSTEGSLHSFQHQVNQINQFGITPRWSWGYANAGDFTEEYTPYTLNGILIRGGGMSINPGLFRFSVLGGYTRRSGAGVTGGFDRYVYGGKIGIGRDESSHIDLLVLRARDIPSKFQVVPPDTTPVTDSTQIGTTASPYQETPQENLVVGLSGGLKLFEDALVLDAEADGSAFTRDMNSPAFSSDRIPSFFRGVYTPRLSSSADYAYVFGMKLNLPEVGLKAGYRRVGPGYNSLGAASLITDLREFMLGGQVRFARWSTGVTWTRQNDNLVKQKLNTTIRQTAAVHFGARPLDAWSATLDANILTLRNYARTTADLIRFASLSLGTSQSVTFGREGFLQSAMLSYMFQKSKDDNPFRISNGFTSHTITASTSTILAAGFVLLPSVSIVTSRAGVTPRTTIQTYAMTTQYRPSESAMVTSLTLGLSTSRSSTSLQLNAMASYRLTTLNTITLMIRRTGFNSSEPATGSYNEYTASLTMSQRI